jgi:hypothetical protein
MSTIAVSQLGHLTKRLVWEADSDKTTAKQTTLTDA